MLVPLSMFTQKESKGLFVVEIREIFDLPFCLHKIFRKAMYNRSNKSKRCTSKQSRNFGEFRP